MIMNAFRKTLVAIAAAATLGGTGLASTQASAEDGYGYGGYGGYGYNSYPSYGYNSYPSYGYNSYPSYGYNSYGGYGGYGGYGYGYGHRYGGYGYGPRYGYGYGFGHRNWWRPISRLRREAVWLLLVRRAGSCARIQSRPRDSMSVSGPSCLCRLVHWRRG